MATLFDNQSNHYSLLDSLRFPKGNPQSSRAWHGKEFDGTHALGIDNDGMSIGNRIENVDVIGVTRAIRGTNMIACIV